MSMSWTGFIAAIMVLGIVIAALIRIPYRR